MAIYSSHICHKRDSGNLRVMQMKDGPRRKKTNELTSQMIHTATVGTARPSVLYQGGLYGHTYCRLEDNHKSEIGWRV